MFIYLPKRLRDALEQVGVVRGEIITAAAFNQVVRDIGCTHLKVFVSNESADAALDHLLDDHLYATDSR